jgi:hypothetical protein
MGLNLPVEKLSSATKREINIFSVTNLKHIQKYKSNGDTLQIPFSLTPPKHTRRSLTA